jgi:HAD superfamily hydrolase (TIGR01549 family)
MDKKREAKSPKTSAESLSLLAQDVSTQKMVASNPNTPKEILLSLLPLYPDEVLQNPALTLFHLEDPDFLCGAQSDSLRTLAAREELPDWLLNSLFSALLKNHWQERVKIAAHERTSQKILWLLASDQDEKVRWFVAQNKSAPAALLRHLANDPQVTTREYVAKHTSAPVDVLALLSNDSNSSVLSAVASNPNSTKEILQTVSFSETPTILSDVARSARATEEILSRLSRHPDVRVRESVALNPNTSPVTIETLSWDVEPRVRIAVIGNKNTSPELVYRLSMSKRSEAPRAISSNKLYERARTLSPPPKTKKKKMTPPTFSTIFFDVGGTLLHVDWVYACNTIGLPPRRALLIQKNEKLGRFNLIQRLKRGPVHGYEFLDCCFSAAGLTVTKDQLEALWKKHLQRNLWRITGREVRETLQALLDQKYRLAVISNSEGKVKELLEETGLLQYFELVVDSGIEGVSKPDAEIFLRGCTRMKVDPKKSLYVGDVFDIDVIGAKRAGMQAALYDPCELYGTSEAKDFLLLRSFSELTRLDAR